MWLVYWDFCGLACFAVTWFVIWFVDYCVQMHILAPWFEFDAVGILHGVVFQAIVVLISVSHIMAVTTDPGSVKQNTATEQEAVRPPTQDPDILMLPPRRFCNKCQCLKPPRAAHCSICHRCIHLMDHHCPWVNNCVGQNNLKFFLLFLFYVFVGSLYAFLLSMWRLVSCVRGEHCGKLVSFGNIVALVAVIFAIFFGIFVASMASDQWEGMVTNTTGIEALKGWDEEDLPVSIGLRKAFGEPFGINWFIPKAIPYESQYHWKPTDDKDAFEPRDPLVQDHQARMRQRLESGRALPQVGQYRDSGSDTDDEDYVPGPGPDPYGHEQLGGHGHSHAGGHSHSHGGHGAGHFDEFSSFGGDGALAAARYAELRRRQMAADAGATPAEPQTTPQKPKAAAGAGAGKKGKGKKGKGKKGK